MAEYIKRDSVTNLIKLMEYPNGVIECYADEFISDINAIPSANVAEVRHGEWEENSRTSISERHRQIHYSIYKCSRCNHANGRYKSNFCPNCGADMREES